MEKETKRKVGRPVDEAKKAAAIECIAQGLGYLRAVPILIEKGFVDDNGKCTINLGSFNLWASQYRTESKFEIYMPKEHVEWAKEHQADIMAYIEARMKTGK